MLGRSHLVIGAATAVLVSYYSNVDLSVAAFVVCVLGALMPDIDGRGKITKLIPFGWLLGWIVRKVFSHRGFTHWGLHPLLFISLGLYFSPPLVWFGLGYASHLLADACTRGGIPLLAPVSFSRMGPKLIITGGKWERAIVSIVSLWALYTSNPEKAQEIVQMVLSIVAE